jgi:hypothetical protein
MQSYDIFGDLLGTRTGISPNDKGHLAVALEVSVGKRSVPCSGERGERVASGVGAE